MAEVGVLDLRIQSEDTSQAANSLGQIANALFRVKRAVNGIGDLKTVANGVKAIKTALEGEFGSAEKLGVLTVLKDNVNALSRNGTATKLTEVAKAVSDYAQAMSKLGSVGDIAKATDPSALAGMTTRDQLSGGKSGKSGGNIALDAIKDDVEQSVAPIKEAITDVGEESQSAMSDVDGIVRDVTDAIREMGEGMGVSAESAVQMQSAISGLMSQLNQPIRYKGFSELVNTLLGVKQKALDAKEAMSVFMTDAAKQVIVLMDTLNKPLTYKGLGAFIENNLGIGSTSKSAEEAWETLQQVQDAVNTDMDANGAFAEFPAIVEAANEGCTEMRSAIEALISQLEQPIKYRGFSDIIDQLQGIKQKAIDAKEAMGVFMTDAAKQSIALLDYLNKPIKYKGLGDFINGSMGIGKNSIKSAEDSASVLKYVKDTAEETTASIRESEEELRQFRRETNRDLFELFDEMRNKQAQSQSQFPREFADLTGNNLHVKGLLEENANAIYLEARSTGKTIEEVTEYIHAFKAAMAEANPAAESFAEAMAHIETASGNTPNVDAFMDYSKIDLATMKLNGMKQALETDIANNKLDNQQIAERVAKLQDVNSKLEEMKRREEEAAASSSKLRDAFDEFKGGVSALLAPVTNLVKQFTRMAKMRMMRYAIRELAKGFSEGIQNVYQYSKLMGGSFHSSMDAAATSMLQMKNSIGAMAAPLVQMLIPYLQIAVNWIISLVNSVNQFLALINGQATWTHALPAATEAFQDQANAAHGASNAMKDLLADWDELNIIQSQSGGGSGSSGSTPDYSSMFEEVGEFESTLEDIVNGINEQFGSVWNMVKKIGTALLSWKFSTAFSGLISDIMGLVSMGALIDLEFNIIQMLDKNFLNTGEQGYIIGNILTTLVGGFFMKKILGKVLKGAFAKLAFPIAIAVSAFADTTVLLGDTDTTALTPEALELEALASLKESALVTYLAYQGGITGGALFGSAVGNALFFMGINIGMKAISDTMDTGKITPDILKENFLSAGLVATGLAITEASLGGTIGTVVAASGGGALFTLGVLFLAEAIIQTLPDKIHWGSVKMTNDQIREFVKKRIFTVDLDTNIALAAKAVTMVEEKKEDLKTKARELIPKIDAVLLGVDVDKSLTEIDSMVNGPDGLVDKFNELQEAKEQQLVLAFSSVKVIDNTGNEKNKEFMSVFEEGWTTLNTVMENLGRRLSSAVKDSYNQNISEDARNMAKQTVVEIAKAMSEVSAINISNETAIAMRNQFAEGLGNIDRNSMDALLEYYGEQVGQAEEFAASQYQTLLDEAELQARNYRDLAAKALENGGEFAGYKYEDYVEMAENFEGMFEDLQEYRDRSIKAALKFYQKGGEGWEMLRDAMMDLTKGHNVEYPDEWSSFWETNAGIFSGEDSVLEGDKAAENVRSLLLRLVESAFRNEDRATVRSAIEKGVLNFSDFFTETMTDTLAEKLGVTGDLKDVWDDVIEGLGINNGSRGKIDLDKGGIIEETLKRAKEGINRVHEQQEQLAKDSVTIPTALADTMEGVNETISEGTTAGPIERSEFDESAYGMTQTADETMKAVNDTVSQGATAGVVDTSGFDKSVYGMVDTVANAYREIMAYMSEMEHLMGGFSPTSNFAGGFRPTNKPVTQRASGGFVRSGDLVMANENGNFEMMGRMGNQPVVANNQQIVSGITQGVSNANGDVVSELRTLGTMMQRMLSKQFVAKAVPGSAWGRANNQSAEAYDRVTG